MSSHEETGVKTYQDEAVHQDMVATAKTAYTIWRNKQQCDAIFLFAKMLKSAEAHRFCWDATQHPTTRWPPLPVKRWVYGRYIYGQMGKVKPTNTTLQGYNVDTKQIVLAMLLLRPICSQYIASLCKLLVTLFM